MSFQECKAFFYSWSQANRLQTGAQFGKWDGTKPTGDLLSCGYKVYLFLDAFDFLHACQVSNSSCQCFTKRLTMYQCTIYIKSHQANIALVHSISFRLSFFSVYHLIYLNTRKRLVPALTNSLPIDYIICIFQIVIYNSI